MYKLEDTEIFQMFGGYLHQDWLYDYGWKESYHFDTDSDKYPHFSLAIRTYAREASFKRLVQAITELQELVNEDHMEEHLEVYVFDELGIYVLPETWNLNHQEFLVEVLQILKQEANKIAR